MKEESTAVVLPGLKCSLPLKTNTPPPPLRPDLAAVQHTPSGHRGAHGHISVMLKICHSSYIKQQSSALGSAAIELTLSSLRNLPRKTPPPLRNHWASQLPREGVEGAGL
ncbi:hypothetical protein AAFF_G00044090 [Aldrovandia affinis]|uniref:Uncharacterized protein n=1 Tax=Aldrovandia affinis TaxID=143900 RepID=A0AAD7S267_9TELE|nr:hypothetical protein AAFF_G00044090 [Aldrovandia affinis]